jgi:hypothetical protein
MTPERAASADRKTESSGRGHTPAASPQDRWHTAPRSDLVSLIGKLASMAFTEHEPGPDDRMEAIE